MTINRVPIDISRVAFYSRTGEWPYNVSTTDTFTNAYSQTPCFADFGRKILGLKNRKTGGPQNREAAHISIHNPIIDNFTKVAHMSLFSQ